MNKSLILYTSEDAIQMKFCYVVMVIRPSIIVVIFIDITIENIDDFYYNR